MYNFLLDKRHNVPYNSITQMKNFILEVQKMFCKNCGQEISDEAVVCPHCGVATDRFCAGENQPKVEKNGMAIAGFVCSFFIPLLGWIFGGVGLSRANKRNGKGKGFSIASLVIATVMFFVYLSQNLS